MPEVRRVAVDPTLWVDSSKFTLERLKHKTLNPVQSAFMTVAGEDTNFVVAASTSAGKTVIAEMAFAHTIAAGKKCIYLCPLKALAQEKLDDWSDSAHFFSKYKIAIATGDYILPENRPAMLTKCAQSDITVMTSELLDSLTRRIEKAAWWFQNVGAIVVDEGHLLSMEGRGGALECALMRFTEISDARIVFISATMPNTEELAHWLSGLNGKDTNLVQSDWRPCKLDIWYEAYNDKGDYYEKQRNLKARVVNILNKYPNDKFIVFTHAKGFGRSLIRDLNTNETIAEFHNADLNKDERNELAWKFKNSGLRILLATSTLAYGLNLPARRVIIAGVTRGPYTVSTLDCIQMCGRAGRVGLDPKGDAHVLIPASKEKLYDGMLDHMPDIVSTLLDIKELAFHIVNEINEGVNTVDALWSWYCRSFAAFSKQDFGHLMNAIDDLLMIGAIKEENEVFEATPVGKVASWFYYSPYVVAQLKKGFKEIPPFASDYDISWAIGNAFPGVPLTQTAKEDADEYISNIGRDVFYERGVNCYAVYCILSGMTDYKPELGAIVRGFKADSDRLMSALKTLSGFYKIEQNFTALGIRLKHGVHAGIADLCAIPGIGPVKAQKLYEAGFRSIEDIKKDPEGAKKIAGAKITKSVL